MRVCQLKLTHFRNYRELDLKPAGGLNILYGANAQGKSNVLEALWLLATTRSLRASRESELILQNEEIAHVTAEVDREREGDAELQVSVFQGDKKAVRVNGMKRERVIDLLGQFNAVFFGALDLHIVTGEPTDRRHYLNVEISQISPRYVVNLGHYKRVLQQRNRLLRDLRDRPRPPAELGLDTWTEQLVRYGAPLLETRRFYIERLMPLAAQIHRELTDGRETLEIRYQPSFKLPDAVPDVTVQPLPTSGAASSSANSANENEHSAQANGVNTAELNAAEAVQANSNPAEVNPAGTAQVVRETNAEDRYLAEAQQAAQAEDKSVTPTVAFPSGEVAGRNGNSNAPESALSATERVAKAFHAQLAAVGYEEARRGTTLLGPQRDDLCFFINGADARIYGSQGQQRTVALSLKLAEFRLIEEYVGEPPVLLLDDVMSDLDDARRKHLLDWIRDRGQTFITCTSLRAFPKEILQDAATFQVSAGTVIPDIKPTAKPKNSDKVAVTEPSAIKLSKVEPNTVETPQTELTAKADTELTNAEPNSAANSKPENSEPDQEPTTTANIEVSAEPEPKPARKRVRESSRPSGRHAAAKSGQETTPEAVQTPDAA